MLVYSFENKATPCHYFRNSGEFMKQGLNGVGVVWGHVYTTTFLKLKTLQLWNMLLTFFLKNKEVGVLKFL